MSIIPFDPSLVTQSVNYHGHNLLKQLVSENPKQFHTIKLQDINYKIYEERQKEIRNLGTARVNEIVSFISSKSDILLVPQEKWMEAVTQKDIVKSASYKDRCNYQQPFECFTNANKIVRAQQLIKDMNEGDMLLTEVRPYHETFLAQLRILALDNGKHRYLSDIKNDLKVYLRSCDTKVPHTDEYKPGLWLAGTRLRVVVLSVNRTENTIHASTLIESVEPDAPLLGKITVAALPLIFSVSPNPNITTLSDCLEKMESFKNPQSIKQLSAENGIDLSKYPSLLPSLRGAPSDDSMFRPVRQRQMRVWAHSSVADGVMHFKQGRHTEAFQCLTKALQIDAENVEAYVAKGALLANLGRYEKAIKDFEVAMKFDPKHENARKYLCETLVELGKQWEEKEKLLEAEKCLLRCLELDKDHIVGKEALKAVGSKLGKSLGLTDLFDKPDVKEEIKKEEEQKEEKDFTDDFEQTEKELLKRKRVKHEDDDIADLPSSPKKLEKLEAVKEASLSPLSQKMSLQQSMWSAPEPQSDDISLTPRSGEPVESLVSAKPMFSNPPPAWPMPNTTMPPPPPLALPMPPMHPMPQSSFEMHNYTEDSNYKAKVEEFLRHLEKKSNASANKRNKRSRRSSEKSMPKKKDRKRRKRSISSSSRSMSSSNASSSASDSSSSQTDDSDESEGARKRKRAKRRKKKRKAKKDAHKKVAAAESLKKAKEEEKRMEEERKEEERKEEERKEEERKQKEEENQEQERKEQERREEEKKAKKKTKKEKKEKKKKKDIFEAAELPIPDFKELEQKLQAYYKKMESISLPEAPQPEMLVDAGLKLDADDKSGAAPASANPSVGLKQPTHPAFLESDSENESKEAKKKEQKKEPKKDQREATKARMVGAAKTPKDDEKAKQKNREDSASSRSPSRSRSRSRSRSYSRSSRSYSSGSRSRSSRSRSHSKSRQFRRRQRSSSHHQERFERGGRWRGRPFIRRSRSPNKNFGRWRHSSRSPPYGYYHNKPFYSFHRGGGRGFRAYHHQNRHNHHNHHNFHNHHNRNQHQGRYERPPPPPHHRRRSPSSPGSPIDSSHFGRRSDSDWHRSSTGEALDDAKRKVERRLADQEDRRSSDEGEERRRSLSRERSEEKDDMKPRQPSPDPSKRFGKWAEGVEANGKVKAEKVKVVAEKPVEIPVATEEAKEAKLDEFESFLQKAKQKSMQVMRERNKEFLKPSE